ncbi:MarR family winged helix-turn-helix transcriptional regulator [Jatrophihabitans sp. YIM 134969]
MPTPSDGVAFLLTQLGTFAAGRYAEAVARLELTPPLTGVLRLLAVRPGLSQQALAGVLGAAPSRVVAWVDDLEGRGWISRVRDPDDRRVNVLDLTAAGRAALAEVATVARAHEKAVTAPLDAAERATLTDLLRRLADHHELTAGVHPGYRG